MDKREQNRFDFDDIERRSETLVPEVAAMKDDDVDAAYRESRLPDDPEARVRSLANSAARMYADRGESIPEHVRGALQTADAQQVKSIGLVPISRNSRSTIGDRFRRFMWFCAGVDSCLAHSLRTERVALTSVGTAVFLTAVLAYISGSYALSVVFESKPVALSFGCLWAAIIFNLDRFVVSSMRKREEFVAELAIAAPRAVVAIIISFVIVVPLELRLFQTEIDQRVANNAIELQARYAAALEHGPVQSLLNETDRRIEQIQHELAELDDRRVKVAQDPEGGQLIGRIAYLNTRLDDLAKEEQSATLRRTEYQRNASQARTASDTAGQTEAERNYRVWMARAAEQAAIAQRAIALVPSVRAELDTITSRLHDRVNLPRIDTLRQDLENQEKQRQGFMQQKERLLEETRKDSLLQHASLLTRLTILSRLAAENKTADWTILLLRLLVVAVELSPIFIKLASPSGSYEAQLAAAAQRECSQVAA